MGAVRKTRSTKGAFLVETSLNTSLFCSLLMLIGFALIQASIALYIMNGLQQASRQAAREAAIIYMKSSGGQSPSSALIDAEFQKIVVPGVVNNSNQFSIVWPATYSKNSHPPLAVTVTCRAAPGQAGYNGAAANIGFPAEFSLPGFGLVFSQGGGSMQSSSTYPLRP